MYTPPFNRIDADAARGLVDTVGSAQLVTVGDDGYPLATLLPVMWRGDTVTSHMAIANPHWKSMSDHAPALLVIEGAQAYISPRWYAAKAEHGRVVPTWNYRAVQLRGTVTVHRSAEWLRAAVTDLTNIQEASADAPWAVDDAPAAYVEGQLKGIVGIEVQVTEVWGKDKLSQNRSVADQRGVIRELRGLTARDQAIAEAMSDGT